MPALEACFVERGVFEFFHEEWKRIDRRWIVLSVGVEDWDAVRAMRDAERRQLRAYVRERRDAGCHGAYLVPA